MDLAALDTVSQAREQVGAAVRAASAAGKDPTVELYSDGGCTDNGSKGSAAVTVYVDDKRVATVTLEMLPVRVRLSSTRTERLGVAMAFEVAAEVEYAASIVLRLDNKSATDVPKIDRATRYARQDDLDIARVIQARARDRKERNATPIEVEWVKGHAEKTLRQEQLTKHHSRNAEVDELTRARTAECPVLTTHESGGSYWTYETDPLENVQGKEHEIDEPMNKHIKRTAALRRTLGFWQKKYGEYYGEPGKAGEFIEIMNPNSSRVGNNFIAKLAHNLLPDGARRSMYMGEKRVALCGCGRHFTRSQHWLLACPLDSHRSVRAKWRSEIIDILGKRMAAGATALVDDLWKINSSGRIAAAEENEEAEWRAPEWMRPPDNSVAAASAATGAQAAGGGGGGGGAPNALAAPTQAGSDDSDDESGEDDDDRPVGLRRGTCGQAFTGKGGAAEKYDEDFSGVLASRDPRAKARRLLITEAERGNIHDFFMLKWRQTMPALLGIALDLSQGEVLEVLRELRDARDEYAHRLWREHLRETGKDGSPPDLQEREELYDQWRKVRHDIGGRPDSRQRRMEEVSEVKTWSKNYIKKRLRQWARLARAFRRQAGRGQPTIIAAFAALGAAAAASQPATATSAPGGGGDPSGARTAGRQTRQRTATGSGGQRKRRAAAPMAPRMQQRDVRARRGGGGGQTPAEDTTNATATAADAQGGQKAATAAATSGEQGADEQGDTVAASGAASTGTATSGTRIQATLANWRKRPRDEDATNDDGATADRRAANTAGGQSKRPHVPAATGTTVPTRSAMPTPGRGRGGPNGRAVGGARGRARGRGRPTGRGRAAGGQTAGRGLDGWLRSGVSGDGTTGRPPGDGRESDPG